MPFGVAFVSGPVSGPVSARSRHAAAIDVTVPETQLRLIQTDSEFSSNPMSALDQGTPECCARLLCETIWSLIHDFSGAVVCGSTRLRMSTADRTSCRYGGNGDAATPSSTRRQPLLASASRHSCSNHAPQLVCKYPDFPEHIVLVSCWYMLHVKGFGASMTEYAQRLVDVQSAARIVERRFRSAIFDVFGPV